MTKFTQEQQYTLLMEGHLDAMFLPSGAIAWLWQYERPKQQLDSACLFGRIANEMGDGVRDAALLRADKNILVLKTNSGNRISVYPDGGLGANGEIIDKSPSSIVDFITGQDNPEEGSVTMLPDDLETGPEMI